MRKMVFLLALMLCCANPTTTSHLVGPSRVQLVKSDGLFSDTAYPSIAFTYDTSSDTDYTGDSTALLINARLNELRLSFMSFEDDENYQSFNIVRMHALSKGDTTVIIGDYNWDVSDAIGILPQVRKYSLNATIHFANSLTAGNYKFVANITEYCYCFYFPTYNCEGNFSIVSR